MKGLVWNFCWKYSCSRSKT